MANERKALKEMKQMPKEVVVSDIINFNAVHTESH
jgi:hypothetical protein